jgi:NAD(P)H dehydrogenase (quinone)
MPSTKPKILIMGATGQVGKSVVSNLASDTSVQIVAATRSPEKAGDLGVPTVRLDLDQLETIAPALQGVERVFMVTGYTVDMLRQSKDFLNEAKRAGVKHIVHLGACGDNDTHVAHYAWHQFIERYIEWSAFSFAHLRPEIFMQNLLGYGGEPYVSQGVIRHYVGGARLSWVDCDDIALVAAACLLDPEKHTGKTWRLGYEAKTCDEVASIFTQTLGQKFSYEARPPEEFLASVLAAGAEPAYMQCVFQSFADLTAGKDLKADEVFDNFTEITGKKPTTLSDFATKHATAFKY